jgi:pyruvate/2-oxoglutarate dehydrogenase complex dihydrolipoamide acyltransferase (E2) component
MSQIIEAKVPDIGDYHDIPVIDLCVAAGDTVKVDDALVTLESDKATMDVPSSVAGVVKEVKVKLGDKVSEGLGRGADRSRRHSRGSLAGGQCHGAAGKRRRPAPQAAGSDHRQRRYRMRNAGPRCRPGRLFGGFPQRRPRHADRPRRALPDARWRLSQRRLHPVESAAAHRWRDGRSAAHGRLRRQLRCPEHRPRQAAHAQGQGRRQADRRSRRHGQGAQGRSRAGRWPVRRPASPRSRAGRRRQQADQVPESDHRRRLATDRAAVHARRPARRRLDRCPRTAPDPAAHAGRRWRHHRPRNGQRLLGARLAHHGRRTRVGTDARRRPRSGQGLGEARTPIASTASCSIPASSPRGQPEGIEVTYSNDEKESFDLVLVAVGRSPNGGKLAAEKAGVAVSERGFIPVDSQLRTNVPHIFAIGDIVGQPMLAHKGCTKRTSPPKPRTAASAVSTPCRSPRLPTPTRKSPGPARPRSNAGPKASPMARASSPGPLRVGPWPTAARRASPS